MRYLFLLLIPVVAIGAGCGNTDSNRNNAGNYDVVVPVSWPDDMPTAVPPFTDATSVQTEADSNGQDYWALQITGVTPTALAAYTTNLAAEGWESDGAEDSGQSQVLLATKDGYTLELVYNPLNQVLRLAVTAE